MTKDQIFEFFRRLAEDDPTPRTELEYGNAYQLVVAVALSAQATDVGVNKATRALFAKVETPQAMLDLGEAGLKEHIKTIGLFNSKAKNVIALSQILVAEHGGEVPGTREALVKLPGVGRKTANVVLGDAFGVPGITVDTHLGRLARRFAWTQESDPEKVEADLMLLFPRKDWTLMSHRVIWHGRRRCHARRPACGACPVARWCPAFGEGPTDPNEAARLVRDSGRG